MKSNLSRVKWLNVCAVAFVVFGLILGGSAWHFLAAAVILAYIQGAEQ